MLPELRTHIINFVKYRDRGILCQVNKTWHDSCNLLATTSCKQAIISGDVYSLLRIFANKTDFLKTKNSRDRAVSYLIKYPDEDVYEFLVRRMRICVPYKVMHDIFLYKCVSQKNKLLSDRCAKVASALHGKSGTRAIAILYNSTLNIIPFDNLHQECDIRVLCANNCILTVTTIIALPQHHNIIYAHYAESLVILARFAYNKLMKIMLKFGAQTISAMDLRACVTRALIVCISYESHSSHDNVHEILNIYCSDEYAIASITTCYDYQYYCNIERALAKSPNIDIKYAILMLVCTNSKSLEAFIQSNISDPQLQFALASALEYVDISNVDIVTKYLDILQYKLTSDQLISVKDACIRDCNAELLQKIITNPIFAGLESHTRSCERAIAIMLRNFS